LLLGILLFNWFGYRFLISLMEDTAKEQLEQRLDETRYDESQLFSIKIPATNLAYYTNSSLFERIDGQIEIEGIQYKYVKRRLYRDSLELLCIPDQAAMRLQTAKINFFQLVYDLQHNLQGKKSGLHPISGQQDFSDSYTLDELRFSAIVHQLSFIKSSTVNALIVAGFGLTAEQPPRKA
jgi:hypothetical protein